MASSSLTCISSILDDMQLLENKCPDSTDHDFASLKGGLRILRPFLMSARKWGNNDDENLAALLLGTEAAISKTGEKIHSFCLRLELEGRVSANDLRTLVFDCMTDFPSDEDIKGWYFVFSYRSLKQSSNNSLMKTEDLIEFMDYLLESFRDDHYDIGVLFEGVEGPTEGLEEKLAFLKNFISFVALHGIKDEQLGPLLAHTELIAVNAACLSYWSCFGADDELYLSIRDATMEGLQKIIPVESHVHETCVQALIASKLSARSYVEADEQILREIIDSLLCNICWILKSGTCRMISIKDQLQMLCDGLRSLRTILKEKEKPNKFNEKMRDLTGLVICDAGLVFLTLSLNANNDGWVKEMDLVPLDLLERIKLIKATIAEECPGTSPFNFPKTNALGFVDSLLKYMMDLKSPEAGTAALVNHRVQTVQEELAFFPSFLGKIVDLCNEDEELQSLWDRVVYLAYRVEFLMDSLLVGDIVDSSSISFDSIVEEIKIIKSEALKISDSKRFDVKVKEVTKTLHYQPSQVFKPTINDLVVGIEDEAASIINRLRRGSNQVQIVPIVGMPGLGKTTLAKKVYNDSNVMSHFHVRAWCTVSQDYHNKHMLLQILTSLDSKLPDKYFEMSEEDLALAVKKRLQKNRYLIILDDIWDTEAWNGLQATFPDNGDGSRVIFTSRYHDIAPQDKLDKEPHCLRPLTHDESWDLLTKELFPGNLPPPELCELQMQIVEICQGLPLTIIILAGILKNVDRQGWKEVVESLSSSVVSSTEQCTATLELSYNNLADNLKPCFLYFGAFPEDHEHNLDKLIWLWVAEGFAQKTQFKSAEDVADDYIMDLISRSLITVSKRRSTGGIKTCRIHDLLHEFCVRRAREEKFFQRVSGYDELQAFSMQHNLRRLCIHSEPEHFCKSRLFAPTIRSLLFFSHDERYKKKMFHLSLIFGIFKLVRVLDLSHISLGSTVPRELEFLVQLSYLAVLGIMKSIPSSIANLTNLETFIVGTFSRIVSLPDTIWNMKKLRHLHIRRRSRCYSTFRLPTNNLDDAAQLCNLVTFSDAILSSWENVDKILRKLPNIRKLKCSTELLESDYPASGASDKILVLDFLSQLESLTLKAKGYVQCQFEFQFSSTIKKLTVSRFYFPWSKISAIKNLPNLEVLKLLRGAFEGEEWNMEEEGFPKVSFLKLASLDIVKWTAFECEECFPSLRKLILEDCHYLEEIPPCLGNSSLEIIEVSDCPYSASFIQPLQEEQMDMGNTHLKIFISSREMDN
nr:putative late blight resistance protein homolog R1A-3 [Coffea arabica]